MPETKKEEWIDFVHEACSQKKTENPLKNWRHSEYGTYTDIK